MEKLLLTQGKNDLPSQVLEQCANNKLSLRDDLDEPTQSKRSNKRIILEKLLRTKQNTLMYEKISAKSETVFPVPDGISSIQCPYFK